MKKLIIILLFSAGMQAQILTIGKQNQEPILLLDSNIEKYEPILVNVQLKGMFEVDGILIKFPVYFKAAIDGVLIYDDKKHEYTRRKCSDSKCRIIHLETKKIGVMPAQNWQITTNPNIIRL